MKFLKNIVALGALVAFAGQLAASSPNVGDDAPAISINGWALNAPESFDGSNLKGKVTLVEYWGQNCGPCKALIPHLNNLWEEYKLKGFQVVAVERQNASQDVLSSTFTHIQYPTCMGTQFSSSYQGNGGIPHCWLIGVDGKVIFEGNPGQIDNLVKSETAKINYPGLGKLDIHPKLAGAAKLFTAKNLGKARDEAQKHIDKLAKDFEGGKVDADKLDDDDKAIFADATFILERVATTSKDLKEKATKLESEKLYLHAYQTWTAIVSGFGKKSEEGTEASEKMKAYAKDKDIKKEMSAYEALEKVQESWKGKSIRADKFNAEMDKIVRSFEGTKAAEVAEASKISEK